MNDAERLELPHIIGAGENEHFDEINEHGYYDRSGNNISFRDWARLRAYDEKRDAGYVRVAEDTVGKYWISTVWIGMNHSFSAGPPLIFETMVFDKSAPKPKWPPERDDDSDEYEITSSTDLDMERYSTEKEAIEGHERMVEKVRLIVEATTKGD